MNITKSKVTLGNLAIMPSTKKESAAARMLNGLAEAYRYALKQAKEGNEVVNQATEIKLHILRPKFV